LRLKTTAVSSSSQRSAGIEFHTDRPATEKARSTNLVLVLWTTYLALLDDCRPSGGYRKKYLGAWPLIIWEQQRISEITIEPIKSLGELDKPKT